MWVEIWTALTGSVVCGTWQLVLTAPASRTVLVVEDDRDVREAMVHLLETEGYAAVSAVDGIDALTQLDGGIEPSVILLDLMMPRMDGWEFLERQRNRGASTPVIIVSAYGSRDHTKGPDVIASMQKPVDIDALLSVVARVCARE
jgi:two-component system response regulator MprA